MPQNPPFWRPGVHAARRPALLARGKVAARVRAWFAENGFVEVETAALQVSPGNETHLHAFATDLIGPGNERRGLYLRTSPEFACKKLLAAGETRIFDFARVFRNRERGALHHPEFTMLEWYRAGEPYETLMDDCVALMRVAADTDMLEVMNARVLRKVENELAEAFAKNIHKFPVSGSDAHMPYEIGTAYIEIPPFTDAKSFLKNLPLATWHGAPGPAWTHLYSTWAKMVKRVTG
jgi:elongation factor P--beta-lysine ligase